MKKKTLKNTVLSAVFLTMGLLLPLLTGQIPVVGKALCPMHLPVLLCGFICGPFWGAAVGIITPILRSFIFEMPQLYPTAIGMAAELCAYGFMSGIMYRLLPKRKIFIYPSLIISMIAGRLVYGVVKLGLYMIKADGFSLAAYWTENFVKTLPAIILQIVIVPPLVMIAKKILK